MANIYQGTIDLIGNTPLVECRTLKRKKAYRQDF